MLLLLGHLCDSVADDVSMKAAVAGIRIGPSALKVWFEINLLAFNQLTLTRLGRLDLLARAD